MYDLVKFNGVSMDKVRYNGEIVWSKSVIPTEVDAYIYDYAESFGNSYSRIDYIPVYGDKIEYEFEPTGSAIGFNFGSRTASATNGYAIISNSSYGFVSYGGTTISINTMQSTLNEVHTLKMSKDGIFLDDVQISYTPSEQEGVNKMVIGALGTGETTIDTRSALVKHRAYTVHSEDDVLKHRILAVVKDDVCQLYDNVTDTYHPSLADEYGQGNLIGYVRNGITYNMDGTEMFPEEEVDGYQLQSLTLSDGAYFDTEYYPVSNGTDVEFGMTITETSSLKGAFGVRTIAGGTDSFNAFYNVSAETYTMRLDVLGSYATFSDSVLNVPLTFEYLSQDNKCIINDVEYVDTVTKPSTRLNYSYYIGTFNNYGTPYSCATQSIDGYHNIYEWVDGVRVPQRTYVPWYRESDGVVCLKNTLDGSYSEIVTGTITAGMTRAEAITANANSLISLGVTPTYDYDTDVASLVELGVTYA